jgi:argininosuccinate lyase
MKLWQKKYELDKQIEAFTVGNDYLLDQKLVKYDCLGSIAHAKMLNKIGILSDIECDKLVMTLNEIMTIDGNSAFVIKQEDEDCHTAIEDYLVKKLGDCGKKIHTARSRNDQVLTALRLYYKNEIKVILGLMDEYIKTLTCLKEKHGLVELPGYTHMTKAMPSSIGLWVESFVESMQDNKLLLMQIGDIADQSPLGTGAGYGLPIVINRKLTKELLGFKKIQNNPIYVQNSRGKFESSILHALSQIMFDLNKISSDLMLFCMPEFGYFELPSQLSTGSSIMPHKKNPDVLEITRANYHKIIAFEFEVKNIISNLISGYNRDLQLTKKPMISGFEVTKATLDIMIKVLGQIKVNKSKCKDAMTKELCTVDKTYKLVKQGVPFRDAYKKVFQEYERNL